MHLTLGELRSVFVARLSEWEGACILFMLGVILLMPEEVFDRAAWVAFRIITNENAVGVLCLASGGLRLLILGLNGMWRPMYAPSGMDGDDTGERMGIDLPRLQARGRGFYVLVKEGH